MLKNECDAIRLYTYRGDVFINNIIKDDFKVSEYMIAYFRSFYDTFKLFYHNAISIEDYACKFYNDLIKTFTTGYDDEQIYMRGIKNTTFNSKHNVPVLSGHCGSMFIYDM